MTQSLEAAQAAGWLSPGDTVVITLGIPVGVPGRTNLVKVETVEPPAGS